MTQPAAAITPARPAPDTEEREVYSRLAALHGLTFSTEEELIAFADPALCRAVPAPFLEHNKVLPIHRHGERVVVASPRADADLPELAAALDAKQLEYRVVTPTDFRRLRMAVELDLMEPAEAQAVRRAGGRDLLAQPSLDARVLALFDAILLEAIARRASDIHLEQYGSQVRFRLRVDGDLHDNPRFQISIEQYLGLVNVVKIKANLDIAERRLPQGGRFSVHSGARDFDLRVQVQPSLHGEHVVIRLLSKEMELKYIEDLGLSDELASAYRRLIGSPSGLILVVGPTGCGKSTTLYAGLQILARDPTRKVITVEDPVECPMDGIQQTQVHPVIGFSFADAMRSFVRQDPDVIMVGEIRDAETALEALRASQTGHVVLSTLHCNDSVDAVQRLFDLQMHPNTVASELIAVFAQRLAKRICEKCRVPVEPDPALAREVFPDGVPEDFRCYRGAGCPACELRGTYGRIAVVEYLPTGPALRRAISSQVTLDELRALARAEGLVSMREHALAHVAAGRIAFDEMPQMFSPEQLRPTPSHEKMTGPGGREGSESGRRGKNRRGRHG